MNGRTARSRPALFTASTRVGGITDTKQDWWLNAPFSSGNDRTNWHSFRLSDLVGTSRLGKLPPTVQIGVKLGNAAFGLIHLLAGHAKAVRNVGPYTAASTGNPKDDVYRTMLSLQSGMQRFSEQSIVKIFSDDTNSKLEVHGTHQGMIVLTAADSGARYSITTMYNNSQQWRGNMIYQR